MGYVKGQDWEKVAAQLPDTILNFDSNFSARRDNFHTALWEL